MRREHAWRLTFLAALLAAFAGCNYFSPAEPEAPTSGTSFVPNYSNPDSTLETIAHAIADKGRTIGAGAYAGAFAESVVAGSLAGYHHFFAQEDVASWQSLNGGRPVPDWGFSLEQTFYTRFVRLRGDTYRVAWAPYDPDPDNIGPEEAIIHRRYVVTTQTTGGAQTSVLAIGIADLRLLRFSDGNWRIVYWNDRRDPGADPTDPEQLTLGRRRLNTQ